MVFNVISMEKSTETYEPYPFEKKQKLADKISVMTDKPTLRKIRDIIKTENPEATSRKSGDGYLMYFQNYTDITYIKIEKVLNRNEKDKLEQQTRSITDMSDRMSDSMMINSDDPNADYTMSRTRLRYSNREKRLIKRQQYEDVIHEQQTNSENDTQAKVRNNTNNSSTKGNAPVKLKNTAPQNDQPKNIASHNKEKNKKETPNKVTTNKNSANSKKPINSKEPVGTKTQSGPAIFSKNNK